MKNKLIPIQKCNNSNDYEPKLIPFGYRFKQLILVPGLSNSWSVSGTDSGFDFRPEIVSRVRECGMDPVIALDDCDLYSVQNPSEEIEQAAEYWNLPNLSENK